MPFHTKSIQNLSIELEEFALVMRCFYLSRNIIGLIIVISPLVGFLCIDHSLLFSAGFLCGLIIGVPLALGCYTLLPFQLWTFFYVLLSCGGCFLFYIRENDILAVSGAVLAGVSFSGLALLLPANLIVSWFRFSKTRLLGVVWAAAFACGLLWKILLESFPYPALLAAGALMLIGVLCFLERPPRFLLQSEAQTSPRSGRRLSCLRFRSTCKVFCYTLILSLSLSLALFLVTFSQRSALTLSGFTTLQAMYPALTAGPLCCAWFIERKGVYSGCVLLIFLTEITIMCFGFETPSLWSFHLGCLALGAALTLLLILLPILVYYLYGPTEFCERLAQVSLAFPIGLATFPLLSKTQLLDPLTVNYLTFAAMFLLMISFFIIFSAWKHRFILLKY